MAGLRNESELLGKFWTCHSGGNGNFKGEEVFKSSNDESEEIFGFPTQEIEVGSQVTITIMSLGIINYERSFTFLGGDISCVPDFQKDLHIIKKSVEKDWNMDAWRPFNAILCPANIGSSPE